MRVARRKMRGKPCYYHLYNRIAGDRHDLPITEPYKAYACALVQDLARYFTLEIISNAWMGNHFHLVLYAAGVPPDLETAANRHNAYYAKRGDNYNPVSHTEICQEIAERMADISAFMAALQRQVAINLNRGEGRAGHLWGERFKSSIIGLGKLPPGSIAAEARQEDQPGGVWRCVKYVELNPYRAGLARDPGDYPFSTWGAFCRTGEHPFHRHFVHHMRSSLAGMGGAVIETWSGRQVIEEFRRQLAETLALEAREAGARQLMVQNELAQAMPAAGAAESSPANASTAPAAASAATPVAVHKAQHQHMAEPGRHWIDGGVVGSEKFVRWVASHFTNQDDPPPKRLGEVTDGEQSLVTLHRIRVTKTRG